MNATIEFLKRHSLAAGLALMFLYTWPIDLANSGVLPFDVPFALYITLGWGFIFASLLLTGLTGGRSGAVVLLKRFLVWRVRWQWYLAALGLFPALFFAAVVVSAALNQAPIDFSAVFAHQIFGPDSSLPVLILPFFLFEALTNGEEMGWRGYVLPRLQAKHSALASSLILGLVWGFWHLPKFLVPGSSASFAVFVAKILAEAVLFTWLYNSTRGSLLLTTLCHASANTAGVFLPLANGAAGLAGRAYLLAVLLEIVAAVLVVVMTGAAQLSRSEPRQIHQQHFSGKNQPEDLSAKEKPAWNTGA